MSGTRLTRKVTVEGSKKLPEGSSQSSSSSSGTRRSVFDRLGPGTSERSRSRESYPPEKCRNWLRDGRCQFGRNCKFLHGPFSEPKSRTKSVRSIVRTDVDRSEGDDGAITVRTQSLDSLEPDDDDEKEISVLKKKKHRPLEESSEPSKNSEKLKRRQQIDQDSSQGEGDDGDDHRKRKKKVRKRQLSGGVVITKPESPEEEERDWEDEDYEEERSDLEWEERGELDYERQLNLEKRRQDLQRQLALMDEEDAKRLKKIRKS